VRLALAGSATWFPDDSKPFLTIFDGVTEATVGLEDVSKFPDLIAELLRRGWSEQDVKKVAGLNALRVLRAAERVATGRPVPLVRCASAPDRR